MKKTIKKKYRSRTGAVVKAERLTEKIVKRCNIAETDRQDICIAVTEAVNNAILHGNNLEPDKYVTVRFDFIENGLRVTVHDQGNGFDLDAVADPLSPENLTKPDGRGLLIVESLMDELKVSPSATGTKVVMVKKWSS